MLLVDCGIGTTTVDPELVIVLDDAAAVPFEGVVELKPPE